MSSLKKDFGANKIAKVAFFCDFFSSLGGTENYNMRLISELQKRDIEVRVYIGEKPQQDTWVTLLESLGVCVKMPSKFHDDFNNRQIEEDFIDAITDEVNTWKPDVIHTHPFKKMSICWLTNKRADHTIPIVATEWTVPTKAASHWFEIDTPVHINEVAAYIATCRAAGSGIRNYHKYRGLIYNIPHLLHQQSAFVNLPKHKISNYSVGCVARFSVEKGVVFLLGAWRRVHAKNPNATLHLYGHGSDELWLRELSNCLGLDNSVRFEGTFSPGKIETIASKHDFFVQPSLFESIPTSAIELMACGRTIVVTCVGGLPELVIHKKNGLVVDPGSTDQLAESILTLGSDTELLKKLSIEAYRRTSQSYNTAENVENIINVYQEVAKK